MTEAWLRVRSVHSVVFPTHKVTSIAAKAGWVVIDLQRKDTPTQNLAMSPLFPDDNRLIPVCRTWTTHINSTKAKLIFSSAMAWRFLWNDNTTWMSTTDYPHHPEVVLLLDITQGQPPPAHIRYQLTGILWMTFTQACDVGYALKHIRATTGTALLSYAMFTHMVFFFKFHTSRTRYKFTCPQGYMQREQCNTPDTCQQL